MRTCEASCSITFLSLKGSLTNYLRIKLVYLNLGQIDLPLSNIVSSDYSSCPSRERPKERKGAVLFETMFVLSEKE